MISLYWYFNTLRPRQYGRHFADDIFRSIFQNENVWSSLKISLKYIPRVQINNIPALVQIIAWRRPGDKPLSEPMMVRLPTHICVTRPQWVNSLAPERFEWNIREVIFKLILVTAGWGVSCEIALDGRHWLWVDIGWGNGLVPSGNKQLPEPMFTLIYVPIWRH